MSTESQTALAEGLGALMEEHGQAFKFNGNSFSALVRTPEPMNELQPRGFAFGEEHDMELTVKVADMVAMPTAGQYVVQNGVYFRVAGVRQAPGSHRAVILIKRP